MQLHQDSHADDDSLEQYSMGSLVEPALAQLEEHLLVCSRCQERLQEIDAYGAAMHSAAARLEQEDETRRRFWTRVSGAITVRRLAWAMTAAAAILVVVAAAVRMSSRATPLAAPMAIWLTASRGAEMQHAPSGRPLELTLETSGLAALASYRVEIVDATGARVFESPAQTNEAKVRMSIPNGLRPGIYFVRLYSPSRELLREYGLQAP